eukprot:gene8337-biopygen15159
MAETNTCIYSGSEANAPGPGVVWADRTQKVAISRSQNRFGSAPRHTHRAQRWPGPSGRRRMPFVGQKKNGIGVRWYPSGVGYGSLAAPPGSRKFRDLVDVGTWWTPSRHPPPPSTASRTCRPAAVGPQYP